MSNYVKLARQQIKTIISSAFEACIKNGVFAEAAIPEYAVEIPADSTHGDFAVNAAMVSAKALRLAPKKIAELLCGSISLENTFFNKCEIAGPGFINFFLNKDWFAKVLEDIINSGESYGRSDYGGGKKIMVEFVSANPTGPMHMGNARGGAIGDCLASALEAAGYDVTREFYINDAGNQIEKFGYSLEARYLQIYLGEENVPFPEDGYHGEDIKDRAKEFAEINGDKFVKAESAQRRAALVEYALPKNVQRLKSDLERYRINYDVWFSENSLHQSGAVKAAIDTLAEKGMTYEREGALWYKATAFGAEKDEVLIRANGNPTYFAADIAYHYNKFVVRGFDRVIDVWGADHHGHVARLKGAMDAIGLDGNKLDIVLMQLVRLMKDGEPVKMSKRTGKAITLADLIDDVPIDAARFFFNMREPNSTLDFDLDLAIEQSAKNPVYYVQYAHARICSIFKNLANDGIKLRKCSLDELMLLNAPEEIELIRKLAQLPDEIISAAEDYDPAGLTRYTIETATLFHKFYNSCRVKNDDEALMQARLTLCDAVRTTIKNVLALLKINAPESM